MPLLCMCVCARLPERCGLSTRTFRTKANIFRICFGVSLPLSASVHRSLFDSVRNWKYALCMSLNVFVMVMANAKTQKKSWRWNIRSNCYSAVAGANRSRNFGRRIDHTNMQIDWDVNMNHEWPGICGRNVFALCSRSLCSRATRSPID